MTPLDVSEGVAKYLEGRLRLLEEYSDSTDDSIRVYSGFLPRVTSNAEKRKLCPAVVVHPYTVEDDTDSVVGITIQVTTYDESMTEGHISLYHLLEVVRKELLSQNPIDMKYQIKDHKVTTMIPDDQPWPQWWGYLEFEVYIPKVRRNLNDVFAFNKSIK
ncbi:hypothetical protein [uncultured Veillonella sp.]|uniref:hypothetical protein n=1 Tax=uncultured Veillonella sp. TaxID=159268 RepID=UPI00259A4306|nr:hypothetical protein [uncultured Veillonella sp.]